MVEGHPIAAAELGDVAATWRTYDQFAAGIDTYRLPPVDLSGETVSIELDGAGVVELEFDHDQVRWRSVDLLGQPGGSIDPYDAVRVRPEVLFVTLPFTSRARESLSLVWSERTRRAIAVHSAIGDEAKDGDTQVQQTFWSGTLAGGEVTGEQPGPSRVLIGHRNVYRYSPAHLYEHVYLSSERYTWQCLQGVQRGHGDTDLSTVWQFEDGLVLFCFREFKIPVASVWLHDLGYQLRTTGAFLGLDGEGSSTHSRAGGYIYPLGSVHYPDAQPI